MLYVALHAAASRDVQLLSEEPSRNGSASTNTTPIPKPQPPQPLSTEISDADLNSSQLDGLKEEGTPVGQEEPPNKATDVHGADARTFESMGSSFAPLVVTAIPSPIVQGMPNNNGPR